MLGFVSGLIVGCGIGIFATWLIQFIINRKE